MIDEVHAVRTRALAAIAEAGDLDALARIDAEVLGKQGALPGFKKALGSLASVDDKRAAGQLLNEATQAVTAALDERRTAFARAERAAQLEVERLDLTETIGRPMRGHAHLVTQAWERLEDVFIGMGFQIAEGPEVETDFHNFEALNMPPSHPARSGFDTMFTDYRPDDTVLLRTHTSPVQIRVMQTTPPPLYMVMPGRVFRRDTPDATHMPVFHQIEGLVIDRGITMAHLAGTIDTFTKAFFGGDFTSRLRPNYFPFTEPSAEFDIQRPDGTWIELGGCGMVHPNVLRAVDLDPEEWGGFAFGFGIDRMARERHGIDDIRDMYSNDIRFIEQFWTDMRLELSWLNDLAPVGDDVPALSEALTHLGLQVEAIDHVGATVAGVITARVLRTERHPDAAKVHRVWVDAGDGVERHVWCGAFNMQAGDVIPLATPGTTMPDGRAIEPRPILGIDSQGMLCSARELGLGDDHSGILILPADTPLGVPYGDALGLRAEVVFDVDLTRNRPDCWGHLGAARDLAAHLCVSMPTPSEGLVADGPERSAPVELIDGHRCGRFTTLVLSGIRVGSSPDWIARRLLAAGMRPINNVVDASNYVMLELNQPNHAYDLDTLGGGSFRIRLAREGESMVTLDGVERQLTTDELLICDGNDVPIGVGGLMGGLDSEISDTTTAVAFECAWFEPTAMTRAMNRLGIRTEAGGRFERGADPYGMPAAQARFVELLRLTCPDLVVHAGAIDARHELLPSSDRRTDVRVARINQVLGTSVDAATVTSLLDPIGYTTLASAASDAGEVLTVRLPSWRPDSAAEIDVIEEVARHIGYRELGKLVPDSTMHGHLSGLQLRRRRLRDVLLGLGASEAITDTFLRDDDLANASLPTDVIRVTNPLIVGDDVLRPSLRPGLLRAIAFNESHRRNGISLFEIGHVYPPGDRSGALPPEYEGLAVALAGRDARDAIAVWREIAASMSIGARVDQGTVPAGMHPTRSATLSLGRDVVGAVGEIHPDVLDAFGVTERIAWLELDLGRLLAAEPKIPQWKATSRYPSTDLDLAFSAPDQLVAEKVDKAIRQAGGALLVDLSLFDVFRGPGVAAGSRSLAYRLRLQAPDRTLTDVDIAAVRDKAVTLVQKLGATLRG